MHKISCEKRSDDPHNINTRYIFGHNFFVMRFQSLPSGAPVETKPFHRCLQAITGVKNGMLGTKKILFLNGKMSQKITFSPGTPNCFVTALFGAISRCWVKGPMQKFSTNFTNFVRRNCRLFEYRLFAKLSLELPLAE